MFFDKFLPFFSLVFDCSHSVGKEFQLLTQVLKKDIKVPTLLELGSFNIIFLFRSLIQKIIVGSLRCF